MSSELLVLATAVINLKVSKSGHPNLSYAANEDKLQVMFFLGGFPFAILDPTSKDFFNQTSLIRAD